MGVSEND